MKRLSLVFVAVAALAINACKHEQAPTPTPRPQPSPAQRAQELFTNRCATCHGPQGTGDGPAAAALNPRPRNFRDTSWHARATDEHLRKVIVEGGASVGLSPLMAANADLATDVPLRDALVAHVRALMTAH
jgi:mono/diheme cytochrome c family protein